jgi:hypothetical protein
MTTLPILPRNRRVIDITPAGAVSWRSVLPRIAPRSIKYQEPIA